jgi:predicted acyltransferase
MMDPVKTDPVKDENIALDIQGAEVLQKKAVKESDVPVPRHRERLYSIDALRGFDMFWIVGGAGLIRGLSNDTGWEWMNTLAVQFTHVTWEGFRFYDLIFPLFMFIAGAVIPFSILSKFEKGVPKKDLVLKTFRRMAVLVLLGIAYNGVLRSGFTDVRFASVLGQIGVSYFFAVLIVLHSNSLKERFVWLMGILVGVAIMQLFIPVPGFGAGVLTPEGHINGYIDRMLLPGRLAYGPEGMISTHGIYDALGILSTISSIGIAVMGTFAGSLLKAGNVSGSRKSVILAAAGAGLILLALAISPFYPVIKNCWSTTFNLLAGGISFILIALFYQVIDVWGWRKWTLFFRVIGMNSIFIYLFFRFVNVRHTSENLFGWLTKGFMEGYAQSVVALGVIVLVFGLLYFFYRKKIFINV